jgi:uncharacterized membrane protein YphA (DoxX/SURF4 family)
VDNVYKIVFLIARIVAGGYFLMNAFNHFTKLGIKGFSLSDGFAGLPKPCCLTLSSMSFFRIVKPQGGSI